MDHELTKRINAWVESPFATRNVEQGALLLLQLTRNQWLYRSACRAPGRYNAIVENELRKHLRIRLDGLTASKVAEQEPVVMTRTEESLRGNGRGLREDHDELPPDIRSLYERNGTLYQKMKAEYNTLCGMAAATPCDRYEHIQILKELDDEYRQNWERYDTYNPQTEAPEEEPLPTDPIEVSRLISAYRKYLSKHLPKVAGNEAVCADVLREMQKRTDVILRLGGTFKNDYAERLRGVGISL